MKERRNYRVVMLLTCALALVCSAICAPIGTTFAESITPHQLELEVGQTKTIVASHAYVWTNTDSAVAELTAARYSETATVKGLKPGIATISVGTAIGQVMTFTYNVVEGGGDGGGDGNTGPGLKEIPGLNSSTPVDTVLSIDGSKWIVINNIEMEGSRYAMLLKQSAMGAIIFEMSGSSYEGSTLQSGFTGAYNSSNVPEVLMNNAVVPKLGDDSTSAVSAPTSKMASSVTSKKDIIFPLSYKEAVNWSGSTSNDKLNLSSQRWWLRTPDGAKWYYVITYTDAPNQGSIVSAPTTGLKADALHLRPAIWVKYA